MQFFHHPERKSSRRSGSAESLEVEKSLVIGLVEDYGSHSRLVGLFIAFG